MDLLFLILGSSFSYLLGSIPSSVWIGKTFYGIDVREHGSGNAGATNTLRVLGKTAGISVLIIDFLKGFAAAYLVYFQSNMIPNTAEFREIQMLFGSFAVLGHVYPVFARFRGGKGIATLLGVIVAISWQVSILCILTFILVVWLSKYISLGSMIASAISPIFVYFIYGSNEQFFIYFCIGVALMVLYTHRTNIERLKNGSETKFTFNKKPEISNIK
ncbi:MAG: glycerol-3-phosphate 1-O-acyltransferase PlsY [Bacteroidota bacterium]|nr:glycerol-3-phosphate 1-O-acyltransferase PlsY [Bacteroidota bacterium]